MNYMHQFLLQFQAQSKQKQLTLAGGMILIVAVTIFLIYMVLSPSYGILFSHLDEPDASQIINQLEKDNIAYSVGNHGQDILVDKRLIDKTRIKLMGSDLQLTHSTGFELFDKTDFGMTDFSQKINYQRALQGELERTINSLDEISHARVQLTIPERQLFQQDNNLPRAAVTLHLKRSLTPQQVKSIQQLISASVTRLPLENVVIVDQNGNGLIASEEDASTGHFSAKKKIEHYLSEKVMQILQPIFSDERVMVKIDATLNYDELQRERVNPRHDGAITHEKETRHTTPGKTGKTPANEDFMREKTWRFGEEKEQFTRANGTIERLTISVVLPQNTSNATITRVERLVKSVVGFNPARGDSISVEALWPVSREPVMNMVPVIEAQDYGNKQSFWIVAVLCGVFIALYVRHRARIRQRRLLLTELNQWLIEHE